MRASTKMLLGTLGLLASSCLGEAISKDQIPLDGSSKDIELNGAKQNTILQALEDADIIPSIIPKFTPTFNVNVSWTHAQSDLGNALDPSDVQALPNITLTTLFPPDSDYSTTWAFGTHPSAAQLPKLLNPTPKHLPQLTIALTDPDAPSHSNPEWSQICHWISTSWHGNSEVQEIMPWKPPGPPPTTGKHRYIFVAMLPLNGTTDELDLRKPADRQHWGYEGEGEGIGRWMQEMGLGVVGANFMYAQNQEQ
ncbi:hypothetical protein MBLNU230_g6266t1 [Neophaeotheca triangularis]